MVETWIGAPVKNQPLDTCILHTQLFTACVTSEATTQQDRQRPAPTAGYCWDSALRVAPARMYQLLGWASKTQTLQQDRHIVGKAVLRVTLTTLVHSTSCSSYGAARQQPFIFKNSIELKGCAEGLAVA